MAVVATQKSACVITYLAQDRHSSYAGRNSLGLLRRSVHLLYKCALSAATCRSSPPKPATSAATRCRLCTLLEQLSNSVAAVPRRNYNRRAQDDVIFFHTGMTHRRRRGSNPRLRTALAILVRCVL